jgi:transcriptional regulator with XRE-family HTH domain
MLNYRLTCQQNYTKINNIGHDSTARGGKNLNLKLKGAIVEAGLSMSSVADKIGISRAAFWKKIAGKSDFTEPEILEICRLLKRAPTEIFFGTLSTNVYTTQEQTAPHNIPEGVPV